MVPQELGVERASIRNPSHCVAWRLDAPLDYLDERVGVRDEDKAGGVRKKCAGIWPAYSALSMATKILPSRRSSHASAPRRANREAAEDTPGSGLDRNRRASFESPVRRKADLKRFDSNRQRADEWSR
jgi:hypothetical protein